MRAPPGDDRMSSIPIPDVKRSVFVQVLEYLYTDEATIQLESAMELFELADRFGIERLKALCECELLRVMDVDTAAHILYMADLHHAEVSDRYPQSC